MASSLLTKEAYATQFGCKKNALLEWMNPASDSSRAAPAIPDEELFYSFACPQA